MIIKTKNQKTPGRTPTAGQAKTKEAGFTLVEFMVAMAVFVILMGIVIGIFIGGLRSQRSQADLVLVNDSASLVLEQMAREMRTGNTFLIFAPPPPLTSGPALQFQNTKGQTVVYDVLNGALRRSDDGGSTYTPITSANVKIRSAKFTLVHLFNNFGSSLWPPRVVFAIEVTPAKPPLEDVVIMTIQTTVSGRDI